MGIKQNILTEVFLIDSYNGNSQLPNIRCVLDIAT